MLAALKLLVVIALYGTVSMVPVHVQHDQAMEIEVLEAEMEIQREEVQRQVEQLQRDAEQKAAEAAGE